MVSKVTLKDRVSVGLTRDVYKRDGKVLRFKGLHQRTAQWPVAITASSWASERSARPKHSQRGVRYRLADDVDQLR